MSRKNEIVLPIANLTIGSLLTEAVRAYLYAGNPSALLTRIVEGVEKHRAELGEHVSRFDHEALEELKNVLDGDQQHLKTLEGQLYEKYGDDDI